MKKLLTFLLSFIIWFLFTGSLDFALLITGLLISAVISISLSSIVFNFYQPTGNIRGWIKKIFYVFVLIGTYLYDSYKSAIEVSLHALKKKPALDPGIVKIKTNLNNLLGIAVLANLITLTPGTVVIDYNLRQKEYLIHWINVQAENEKEIKNIIVGQQEKWIKNIFESTGE